MPPSAGTATPLWITPLIQQITTEDQGDSPHYEVIRRVVSKSPHPDHWETEIETVLEAFIGPGGDILWRRVVVRSGTSCPRQVVHASFKLPDGSPTTTLSPHDSILCWAAFQERPGRKLLCVLASPTLLCIWDAYPHDEGKGAGLGVEGHCIPLPFEARSIHPIGDGRGILLQRMDSMEDRLIFDLQSRTWTMNGAAEDDDDGFFLKAPPRPIRLGDEMARGNPLGGAMNFSTNAAGNPVPSFFSLSHPLDDVLPVSLFSNEKNDQPRIVSDVFEKVLFAGLLRWANPNKSGIDRREYSQPICVTYHTVRQRHAIWEIRSAPPPPPQAPLWQVTHEWRSNDGCHSHLGGLQQDIEDLEYLGAADLDSSHYDTTTRHEALADALGIRKTPRKAVEDVASRARGGATSRSRRQSSKVSNSSLLSPMSRPGWNENHMELDTSAESIGKSPLASSLGPFSSLHPAIAMSCLYEEEHPSSQAGEVFLASNLEGSGTLVICLVSPTRNKENPNQLQLFRIEPGLTDQSSGQNDRTDHSFSATKLGCIPCISAQPVQATSIPPCCRPRLSSNDCEWQHFATDILLLASFERKLHLSLYRSNLRVVDCGLRPSEAAPEVDGQVLPYGICGIANAVHDRVDLVFLDKKERKISQRGRVSMVMSSNALCEQTMQAIETGMLSDCSKESLPISMELALKIRADCVRLEQRLSCVQDDRSPLFQDAHCTALETALAAIFHLEMVGKDVNSEKIGEVDTPNFGSSAWEQLLESEFHHNYSAEDADSLFRGVSTGPSPRQDSFSFLWNEFNSIQSVSVSYLATLDESFLRTIFDALHMLYEDFKLSANSDPHCGLSFVGSIVARVCLLEMKLMESIGRDTVSTLFLDHYRRDLGKDWLSKLEDSLEQVLRMGVIQGKNQFHEGSISSFSAPPCFMSWFDGAITGEGAVGVYNGGDPASVNEACRTTQSLLRILSILFDSQHGQACLQGSASARERDHKVVKALIEEGLSDASTIRDDFPAGIALPLLEVLHRCRGDPSLTGVSGLDPSAWALIGREDVSMNIQSSSLQKFDHSSDFRSLSASPTAERSDGIGSFEDIDKDGITPLEITSSMLFPNDNRIREVGRLLRSSRPSFLTVPRAIEVSDHDYERMKQDKLLLLSRRVLALPVGRGMFTIGNLQPVPAEPLPVPDLSLVGRIPPTNAMLALDIADCPMDLKVWPEFHNGVAAGLRLPLEKDASELVSKITRTWIVYNRPPRNSQSQSNANGAANLQQNFGHSHGGLLMALGLRGHLTTLEMTDIFDYLTQGSVTTTVGVLLGMAANMRGSCDVSVSKMLCLHIPSLIPQHFSAIDVASPVQAAAVAGAGLLYQSSSHRMMTEFLLNEIGKRPASDLNAFDREAYTLACGLALGMVNLCQGERLNGSYEGSGSAGLADLKIEERLYRYVVGGLDNAEMRRRREEDDRLNVGPSSANSGSNEKCSCVFEGESINTDVTAPGATLALGLIYMKSGNKSIASALALPDTHFLLEYVRPDFLMLRVIARSLILWDDVEPSKAWIEAQLPSVVRTACRQMRAVAKKATGLSDSTGVDGDERAEMETEVPEDEHSVLPSSQQDQDYDRQAVRQIYTHVIAGACFSIGLRYAGTGDEAAAASIFERVQELQRLRDVNDPASVALRPAGPVLEMCLGCAAISLALVLAGTGDLNTLKLLKTLRWRCDEDVNYGTHMTYGSAIGLLFLGGGSCTLGRDPEDIAALVASFFPRYPSTTSDNQYHLQALRNLYALAVKPRELRAVDVDTGEGVFVPIEIHFSQEVRPLKMTAPCLLRNTAARPSQLRVVSERYYPLSLDLDSPPMGRIFFVKKRSAHLSYRQDPDAQRSLLVQTGSFRGGPFLDLVASFTEDPKVIAFAQYLCGAGNSHSANGNHDPFTVSGFCTRVLHECLTLDTEEALPLYLALRSAIEAVKSGSRSSVRSIWDFRLIRSYYGERKRIVADSSPRLLNDELVTYLSELVENVLADDWGLTGDGGRIASKDQIKGDAREGLIGSYYDSPLGAGPMRPLDTRSDESMDLSL